MRLLISGYGGKSGDTAGVYDLDEKRFIWNSGIESISFMCLGEDGAFFGAGEHDDHGFVYMFVPEGGGFKLAGKVRVDGGLLCHIAYSAKHKILTGACYGSGDVFSVEVSDGFGEMKSYMRQGGKEAELSRAHCTVFGKNDDELFSANIALDRIYRYEIADGALIETGYEQLENGVGPRHLLFTDDRKYVITEYSNEIIELGGESRRVSTLAEGFSGVSNCSGICLLPVDEDFGYVYGANRGEDTIAVFKLNRRDGSLFRLFSYDCGGKIPRHIEIVTGLDNPMLAVANQESGEAVLFEIKEDGGLGDEKLRVPFEGAAYAGEYSY